MWLQAAGGLGMFLLGMIVMTDGLRTLAGEQLRRTLIRHTRSPLSGAVTGALATAVLQSSSATTVAAVGFVAANLMSFPAALGIILGANMGTTITGWMVALLGFKLKLGLVSLPLVFIGAVLRLFGRDRLAAAGLALAGFGLIFVGITTLQEGLLGLRDIISFDDLPGDTLAGRVALVAIGIAFTIIAQSSSAGVATTLTAINTGLIEFQQGAALVIGMDVGTTVTALIATVGAGVNARRTGLSHVVYNLMTGVMALIFITPYVLLWNALAPGALEANAEIGLVAFHTAFNTIGVIVALPFVRHFTRAMERFLPGDSPNYTAGLDPALAPHPAAALNAVQASLKLEFVALLRHVRRTLDGTATGREAQLQELQTALEETSVYLDGIHASSAEDAISLRLLALIHALEHEQRLLERCEDRIGFSDVGSGAENTQQLEQMRTLIDTLMPLVTDGRWLDAEKHAARCAAALEAEGSALRIAVVEQIGRGGVDVPSGTAMLEALRWLQRVAHHIARISHHMSQGLVAAGADTGVTPAPGREPL